MFVTSSSIFVPCGELHVAFRKYFSKSVYVKRLGGTKGRAPRTMAGWWFLWNIMMNNIYGISMEYFYGISMEYLWNIFMEYLWNIYGISLWNIYGISMEYF